MEKVLGSETDQRLQDLALALVGPYGALRDGTHARPFLYARSETIMGGTSEIQRNVIAQRILGLPRDLEKRKIRGQLRGYELTTDVSDRPNGIPERRPETRWSRQSIRHSMSRSTSGDAAARQSATNKSRREEGLPQMEQTSVWMRRKSWTP
jgi:hypothetical protein